MMMKKSNISFAAAVLLALAGCNKETATVATGDITIDASIGAMTKVSYNGNDTHFTDGDQIAVYAWVGSPAHVPGTRVVDGVKNRFDGTNWTPEKQMRWKTVTDPHYFLGVYPAKSITDFKADDYTLDPADYIASDLLIATNLGGVKAGDGPVALCFDHAMARLNVNLRFRNEYDSTPAVSSVSVKARKTATVNYLTKAVTATGDASAVDIPASATAASGYALSFSGLQVPQSGVTTVTVTIAGNEYVYESAADIPLQSGKYTTLNLVVGKDRLELSGLSVSDWTASSLPGIEADPTWELATPLTIEAAEAGAEVRFDLDADVVTSPVYFRTHDGIAWSDWAVYAGGTTVTLAHAGDRVQFKGDNASYARNASGMSHSNFKFSKDCYVYGNAMSLITSSDFSTCVSFAWGSDYNFTLLFAQNSHLLSHPSKSLLLPATSLAGHCYDRLFEDCSNMTTAPELPAKTLMPACYEYMFYECFNLSQAPVLPATTLANECYLGMFYYCTSLTVAPALPAMTLEDSCYMEMFRGCSGLITAPELPATTLVFGCYESMFYGCKKLSSVTCLATDIPSSNILMWWLTGAGTADGCERKLYVKPSMLINHNWNLDKSGTEGKRWTLVSDHNYVDLGTVTIGGVEKNLKWATCNIGADNPWDNGGYFAWGETETKSNYIWATYRYGDSFHDFSRYTGYDYATLRDEDDAACQIWGDEWRIPTAEEWTALLDDALYTWEWTDDYLGDGSKHTGRIVTRKSGTGPCSGNSIFLPASGCMSMTAGCFWGDGYYWTSTLDDWSPSIACNIEFSSSSFSKTTAPRYVGYSIRPVLK